MQKRAIILGAGISGLSLAFYLRKYMPHLAITILEKKERAGGVIHRNVFDFGPKTFKTSRSKELLELIQESNLSSKILYSAKESEIRYLYYGNKLRKLPSSLASLCTSSFTPKILTSFLKELSIPKGMEEETIGAFFRRRFGNFIADYMIEPFVVGICGGDMHKLSMNAYFPELKKMEHRDGSVLKAFFKKKKGKKDSSLFNLEGGLFTLLESLASSFKEQIVYNQEVKKIEKKNQQFEITTDDRTYFADQVFFSLPLSALETVKTPFENEKKLLLQDFPSASLLSVSFGFKRKALLQKGFGYLVPSVEKDSILGVLFDSQIFPNLISSDLADRITVLMGGSKNPELLALSDDKLIDLAYERLSKHLQIKEIPDVKIVTRYEKVIPQYPLFHEKKMQRFQEILQKEHPSLSFVGNYVKGASVNACVQTSKEAAQKFAGLL